MDLALRVLTTLSPIPNNIRPDKIGLSNVFSVATRREGVSPGKQWFSHNYHCDVTSYTGDFRWAAYLFWFVN